jgi:hypothetical protein
MKLDRPQSKGVSLKGDRYQTRLRVGTGKGPALGGPLPLVAYRRTSTSSMTQAIINSTTRANVASNALISVLLSSAGESRPGR